MNMKFALLPGLSLLFGCAMQAVEPPAAPAYVNEAPLPAGWPQPGPYNQVSLKSYPAYRAAFTRNRWQSFGFWTLFAHIKRHQIPMTAPVELTMKTSGEQIEMSSMAFLYRAAKFGSLERSASADARVAQAGAVAGLEFRHDLMLRTPNTVDAHRLINLAGVLGVQDAVVERLFRGYFQEGVDVGDRAELVGAFGPRVSDFFRPSDFGFRV